MHTSTPPLSAIAYLSSAIKLLSEPDLEALLADARQFNAQHGVSGVLLHHDGTFFQYIEGHRPDLDLVYGRIKASTRHRGLIELLNDPVERRHFAGWRMGLSAMPASTLLALERANWRKLALALHGEQNPSPGLALLLQFWRSVPGGGRLALP
jgi:hypothetical protein